ncbi:methyltransferase domain-containing protein [Nitrospira sp. Kam-Ns4a]
MMSPLPRRFLTLLLYTYWWLHEPSFGFLLDRRRTAHHLTRFAMYRRLREVLRQHPCPGRILSISGCGPIVEMLSGDGQEVVQTDYPDVDMQALPYPDGTFGAVVSDQVLEHVRDPARAVGETLRVLAPGGLLVHTSCFLNPVHRHPVDLWRFTPEAMAGLVRGAEILECGGWGNRSALVLMFMGVGHHLVPEQPDHPLHRIALYNDPTYPIVTWVVARK